MPPSIANEYELMACLVESSDKAIYLVRSHKDLKPYIVKCTSEACMEDLASEFFLLKSLSHKGLPRVVKYFKHDGYNFMIREFISGANLYDHIRSNGFLSVEKCMDVMLQLCDILSYLHKQNPPVIHRDIKPQNIILTEEGDCRLIDLGISRRFKNQESRDTVFMGTEITAAPEQFGFLQTDMRSDIYSLGVLMFFLLTGSLNIKRLPDCAISGDIKAIIAKCVEFSPEKRFSSVEQLRSKLLALKNPQRISKTVYWLVCLMIVCAGAVFLANKFLFIKTEATATSHIVFKSPLIEKAVRQELGKTNGEPLLAADLTRVSKLLICGNTVYSDWYEHQMYGEAHHLNGVQTDEIGSITTIEDLSKLTNLRELALYNQNIEDLSPIKGLRLTRLGLGSNLISDISLVKGFVKLEALNIADNPIQDISPLKDLLYLKDLDISATFISDLSPLWGHLIDNLSMLVVPLADYASLSKLPRLTTLRVREVNEQDMAYIYKLTTLKNLTVYASHISDLTLFAPLKNLEMLDVFDNDVRNLQGIEALTLLRHLCIGANKPEDLSPLASLMNLKSVDVNNAVISDYSPLSNIPNLERVTCNKTQVADIEKACATADFEIIGN